MSLVQLSPATCLETATFTSEHVGPDPKLNERNESEDYFSPCQVQVPLNSHAKVHHKALASASITDTHKRNRLPGLQGVQADQRQSDSSAAATWSSAQLRELGVLC